MATLTGKLVDVTSRSPDSISSITVKAPSARIGGGTDVIVSSPASVDFDSSTGDITINGLTGGLSWLFIEGDGWADSIPLAVAEGMITLVEAIANAAGVPGLADLIALLLDLQNRIDNIAQDAVDEAAGGIQWNKGNSTSLPASTASDLPGLVTEIWSSSAASQLGLPVAARGLVFGDQFGTAGWQSFIAFEASGPITYERSKTNDVWTDWVRTTPDYTGLVSVTSSNVRPDLTSADELPNGPTEVWSTVTALDWGLPVGALGTVYTQRFGNSGTQIFVAGTGSDTELWARSRRTETWSEWKMYGGGGGSSSAISAGYKTVPLAFTLPGGNTTQTQAAGSVRVVRQWAHMPKRVRVHIRNGNPANGTNVGAMTISAKVGAASEAGALRETVDLGAVNLPASGEWVSKWIALPTIADEEYLGIAAGFTGTSTSQALLQGGGWMKHTYEGWDQAEAPTTGWTKRQTVPFYMWVEAEVPSTAPVTLVSGDSISLGTATDNPVTDSWVAISALERGALPVFYSQHGSTMEGWAAGSTKWDGMYPDMDVTADSVILALGQNDLLSADLSALKTRYASVVNEIESRWPGAPRFAAYVTPSNKEPSVEAIRKNFNSWLAGFPHGERGALDVASVVGTPDGEDLRPEYSADTLHPNTAGQKAMAEVLTSAQVAPSNARKAWSGVGSPEGKIAAPVGSVYTDTAATNGAIRWIKSSGSGATGWKVEYGDTGVRNITSLIAGDQGTGTARIQRVGNTVMLSFNNIPTPGEGTFMNIPNFIPVGFRSAFSWQYLGIGKPSSIDAAGPLRVGTNGDLYIYRSGSETRVNGTVTYISDTPWPTTLPGTPA